MAGEIANAMANAPKADAAPKGDKAKNPIVALFGSFKIQAGSGREYKRQIGWGDNKKDHPDGGTRTDVGVAVVMTTGLFPIQVATVNRETWVDKSTGKTQKRFSVSVGRFLNAPRGNTSAIAAVDEFRLMVRREYERWAKLPENAKILATKRPDRADTWTETDADDKPAQ